MDELDTLTKEELLQHALDLQILLDEKDEEIQELQQEKFANTVGAILKWILWSFFKLVTPVNLLLTV